VLTVPNLGWGIAAIEVAVIDAARIAVITLFVTKAPRILGNAILVTAPDHAQRPYNTTPTNQRTSNLPGSVSTAR
jgi:hypothetical protein